MSIIGQSGRMPISADTRQALTLLERIQRRLQASENVQPVSEDLHTLISVLESPVFRGILNIQDSLRELRRQLHQHPSILPVDFDITATGELVLNLPERSADIFPVDNLGYDLEAAAAPPPSLPHRKSVSTSTSTDASLVALIPAQKMPSAIPAITAVAVSTTETQAHATQVSPSLIPADYVPATISTYPYTVEFQRAVAQATQGREVLTVQLYKPEGSSLGFSVVGLKSDHQGELGIFVQEIQPTGLAAR